MNHFQRSKEYPFHISIGAVAVEKDKKVACHYFKELIIPDIGSFKDLRILMRETIEPGESIEQCLARGLMEEFGVEASIRHYIGSIVSRFPLTKGGQMVEKTTLYFLCDLISSDISRRRAGDPESGSAIEWVTITDLIAQMKEQAVRHKREDADESSILIKALPFI